MHLQKYNLVWRLAIVSLVMFFGFNVSLSQSLDTYVFDGNSSFFEHAQFVQEVYAEESIPENGLRESDLSADCGWRITCGAKKLTFSLAILFGKLIATSAGLFGLAASNQLMSILNLKALYTGWAFVRDVFNIFFILILLFSAFSTIFQVSRYHLKNTLLMVIVMALLVNFSWPIARVIIDMSNVMMFFFLYDHPLNIMAILSSEVNFAEVVLNGGHPYSFTDDSQTFSKIIMVVIVTFIFMITMLAFAMQLLIRIAALAVLLVCAPVGFAGMVFPATQGLARSWWQALFKYAFMGPILIFVLVLTLTVLQDFNATKEINQAINAIGSNVSMGEPFSITIIKYIIPLTFLWAGLIAGGKLGGAASAIVTSKAQGVVRGTGRRIGRFADRRARTTGRAGAAAGKAGLRMADNKVGSPYARISGGVAGVAQRFRNSGEAQRKTAEAARVKARANTVASKRVAFGRDKNAHVKQRDLDIAAQKVELKDTGLASAIGQLTAEMKTNPNGAKAAALQQTLAGHKEMGAISDDQTKELLSAIATNKEGESRTIPGDSVMIEKALVREGKADKVVDAYGDDAAEKIVAKIDPKSLAKNGELITRAVEDGFGSGSKKIKEQLSANLSRDAYRNEFEKSPMPEKAVRASKQLTVSSGDRQQDAHIVDANGNPTRKA